jgi:hypothetical protein
MVDVCDEVVKVKETEIEEENDSPEYVDAQ